MDVKVRPRSLKVITQVKLSSMSVSIWKPPALV
jgi:hypothetical protein